MMYRVTDGLKEAELEAIASFDTDAQIGKDEESLM